jgi:hypothetical protein
MMAFFSPVRERVRERGIAPERKNDGRRKEF